jgi:hypothetical protein
LAMSAETAFPQISDIPSRGPFVETGPENDIKLSVLRVKLCRPSVRAATLLEPRHNAAAKRKRIFPNATPKGAKWHALTVMRLPKRLAA